MYLVVGHSGVWYSVSLKVFSEESQNFTLEVSSVTVTKSHLCCSQRQKVYFVGHSGIECDSE